MANIKTIVLSGAEEAIELCGNNCDIRNDGTDTVYASAQAGVAAGADGVLSVPAGQTAKLLDCEGTVYLLGTGSVMLCGNDYSELVFKSAATSSGEGGEDTVARNAINTHVGNTQIHLTAAELEAAVNEAKEYADSLSMNGTGGVSQDYVDTGDSATLEAAKAYADSIAGGSGGGVSQDYVDSADESTLAEANDYTDLAIEQKLIVGTQAANLDNCPEGCWYGQYST